MKEKKEDVIAYHQMKRKKHKMKLTITTVVLIVIAIILIGIYCILSKQDAIKYKETSNINYKINLMENEFYEKNYIDEGIDIISSLIKNINVEFSYNLDLEEELEYTYSYKILAETQLKEKSKTNSIYETKEEILDKTEKYAESKNLVISEKFSIDYNKYNDQINKLIDSYKLTNTISELNLSMYLNLINKSTGEQIKKETKVMSLNIPLTTKTAEITVNENVKDNQGEIIIKNQIENIEYILLIGVLILIIGLITLGILIKYILDTRSAEKMYEDELKKILFDYKSYVQKITNKVDCKDYKIIKIDTFKELLEMREELQVPILMYTEEEKNKTTFMMINTNLLFMYILEAKEIRKKLIKRSKERKEKKEIKNEKNK